MTSERQVGVHPRVRRHGGVCRYACVLRLGTGSCLPGLVAELEQERRVDPGDNLCSCSWGTFAFWRTVVWSGSDVGWYACGDATRTRKCP